MNENIIGICKSTINSFYKIGDSIFDDMISKMTLRTTKGKSHLLRNGDICTEIGIICSGIIRVYEIVNGEANIVYFNFQPKNPIVSDYSSFISGKPSKFNIETVNECEILFISKKELYHLFDKYHEVERLGRILAEKHYIEAMERIISFQTKDAKQRYSDLVKSYPDLNKHVPDRMIASYLGIRHETFCRYKSELLRIKQH